MSLQLDSFFTDNNIKVFYLKQPYLEYNIPYLFNSDEKKSSFQIPNYVYQ
jgi:hypothetical protein